MSKGRGANLEPYDGNQMRNYLVSQHGARKIRQTGNHGHYVLPNGMEVGVPENGDAITRPHANVIAGALDMTLIELREAFGYQRTAGAGRQKRKAPRAERQPVSKRDALAALSEAGDAIRMAHRTLSSGHRDASVYEAAQSAALAAKRAVAQVAS